MFFFLWLHWIYYFSLATFLTAQFSACLRIIFISLPHSFVPWVSAAEASHSGPLGPSDGPHTSQSHRHHRSPTQRDGFPASSDKTLCHYPAHHTVSVLKKALCKLLAPFKKKTDPTAVKKNPSLCRFCVSTPNQTKPAYCCPSVWFLFSSFQWLAFVPESEAWHVTQKHWHLSLYADSPFYTDVDLALWLPSLLAQQQNDIYPPPPTDLVVIPFYTEWRGWLKSHIPAACVNGASLYTYEFGVSEKDIFSYFTLKAISSV